MILLRHSNMGATRKSFYLHISQQLLSILKAELYQVCFSAYLITEAATAEVVGRDT